MSKVLSRRPGCLFTDCLFNRAVRQAKRRGWYASVFVGYVSFGVRMSLSFVLAIAVLPALISCEVVAAEQSSAANDGSKGNSDGRSGDTLVGPIQFGFGGKYRVGQWTQLRVVLRGAAADKVERLIVTVPDGDDVASEVISPVSTFTVADTSASRVGSGERLVSAWAKFGRVDSGEIRVAAATIEGAILSERVVSVDELPLAMSAGQQLVLTVGSDIGLEAATAVRKGRDDESISHVQIRAASELPDSWLGYSGVDAVFLPTGNSSVVDQMSAPQIAALQQWVQLGGRVVISAASQAERLLGPEGRLRSFSPASFERVTAQRQTSGIEAFAGTADRLDVIIPRGELSFSVPLALFGPSSGSIVAYERSGGEVRPTILRGPLGLGHVTLVGFDLDAGPVASWTNGRPKLVAALLDLALGVTRTTGEKFGHQDVAHLGFNDIVGQLRSALDQFTGVQIVPFSLIASLIVAYIVLIGPVDYLLLKHLFRKRFAGTWITFPCLVLASCILAGWLAIWLKGDSLRLNRVEIVDIDLETGQARGLSWGHLFSPRNKTYDVEVEWAPLAESSHRAASEGRLLSWQGLPGDSFGGMNTASRLTEAQKYQIPFTASKRLAGSASSELTADVRGLPIDVWASRSLHGEWWAEFDLPSEIRLTADANNQLRGVIHNPLPIELTDCVLCYDRWAYELPAGLKAGQRRSLSDLPRPVTVARWLTKKTVLDGKDRNTPWDRYSLDVGRIAEMMMFHEAAGGRQYTSLLHRFQSRVDLSEQLTMGRAILLGKSSQPTSDWSVAGQEQPISGQRWYYYRLVLPVESDGER